jgi:hypothetical protein
MARIAARGAEGITRLRSPAAIVNTVAAPITAARSLRSRGMARIALRA